MKYKVRSFPVFGKDITTDPDKVFLNEVTGRLTIPTKPSYESPVKKISKLNTPSKSVHKRVFNETPGDYTEQQSDLALTECVVADIINEPDNDDDVFVEDLKVIKAVSHLKTLLPCVTAHLAEQGRLEEWNAFFNLISDGSFPANHISLQLFLDVVKFATIENASSMRYTPEVKEFWAVGKSMFKSKFIRFMCGFKTTQPDGDSCTEKDKVRSNLTNVNFICPDKNVLLEQKRTHSINCETPGVLEGNIDVVGNVCANPDKRYNICIDGKKIAPGFGKHSGEVDLFGHESTPTLKTKRQRLDIELSCVQNLMTDVNKWIQKDLDAVCDIENSSKVSVKSAFLNLLSIITLRIKEIRETKVRRQITLEKLVKLAGDDWLKSKYSFAISSIKTQMYTINMLLEQGLDLNKHIGLIIAACNDAEYLYSLEKIVYLKYQKNYMCLKYPPDDNSKLPENLIKQRSSMWFDERRNAKVTGSTMNKALGLGSLKDQREHFNKVVNKNIDHDTPQSTNSEKAMEYGTVNEINAVGSVAATILPVLEPLCTFHEEGFYKLSGGSDPSFFIVSPDGSCRTGDIVQAAVEIKCPIPGKQFTTDVHYTMPKYYVAQCLSEMAALHCNKLFYLSWTPESIVVLEASFDEEIWTTMQTELIDIYGNQPNGSKPKLLRKRLASKLIASQIQEYIHKKVRLLAEFPSSISVPCNHFEERCQPETCPKMTHSDAREDVDHKKVEQINAVKVGKLTPQSIQTLLKKAEQCITDMYNILRLPAKEILVTVLSDMDRTIGATGIHGVPIAYGLSGYSLKVGSVRSMINEIITKCQEKGIYIQSISTDGQFYQMCVRSSDGGPLTVLQVAKHTWEKAKKLTKAEQIQYLMGLNYFKYGSTEELRHSIDSNLLYIKDDSHQITAPIIVNGWKEKPWPHLFNPPALKKIMRCREKGSCRKSDTEMIDFDCMPLEAVLSLDKETNSVIDNAGDDFNTASNYTQTSGMNGNDNTDNNFADFENSERENGMDIDEELTLDNTGINNTKSITDKTLCTIIEHLRALDTKRKHKKWGRLQPQKLKQLLASEPSVVLKAFTKDELFVCATHFEEQVVSYSKKCLVQMTKLELVNAFSYIFGSKTVVGKKSSPPTLRQILRNFLSKTLNKQATNAILATHMFIDEDLPNWRNHSLFKDNTKIDSSNERYTWYSQPEYFACANDYIVFLLDCHHLFVNARSYVCQHDIPGLNVSTQAWKDVARLYSVETGLNTAMVCDVIDRQSNAIAQIVFGEKVENKMRQTGWYSEAMFCKTMREWYMAEDEPGLTVDVRHQMRMNMRNLLLSSVNLAEFPPPGQHIGGMPIVMFEGILTNIDRRTQLHELLPSKSYNVRAPNTLAVENLFSGFQDLDPKSSGVLLADDVGNALETASYLVQMRLNPER